MGKAWDKPGVSEKHKAGVRAEAKRATAADRESHDDFERDIKDLIFKGSLDEDRKDAAFKDVTIACKRLRDGLNPTDGLKPPKTCVVCSGSHGGGTHDFLCLKRKRNPGPIEFTLRQKILARLAPAMGLQNQPEEDESAGESDGQ